MLLHVALFGQFGNGSDGIPVIGSNTIVNSYKKIQSTSGTTFTVLNTSAFSLSSGNLVLVINMLTGEYELRTVVSVSGTDVNLAAGTISNTVFANYSQMIKVPQFSNVSISAGNSITCPAWDGETGGVICFLVSNVLSLDAGEIDASNKGFFGGNGGIGGTGGLGGLGGFSGSNTSSSGLYGMGGSGINGAGNGGAYGDLGTNGTNGSLAFFNSTTTILPCGNAIASCNNTHYSNSASHLYLGDGGAGGNGGNGKTGAGGGGSNCATPGENGEIGGNGGNGGNGGIGGGIILIKAGSINHNNTLIKAMGSSGTAGTSATNGGVGGDGICGGGGGDGADGGNGGAGGHGGAGGAIKISKGGGAVNTSFVNVAGGSAMIGGIGGQGGLGGLNSNASCACGIQCDLTQLINYLTDPITVVLPIGGITHFIYDNGIDIVNLTYSDLGLACNGNFVGFLTGTIVTNGIPGITLNYYIASTSNNILTSLIDFVTNDPFNLDLSGQTILTPNYFLFEGCIVCSGSGVFELPENGDPGINGPSSTPGGVGYYDEECVAPAIATISNMTICQGQSVTFYGQTLFSTGQYSHTLQSVSGCDSIVTLNLTVNPLPTISGNTTLCENTTSLLIGSGTPAITPWLSSNPGVVTISTNGIVTALSPGSTVITYTNSNGCSVTYTLTVNPLIQPQFTQFGPYCDGASIPALPTTSTNGIAGTWSPAINNAAPTIAVTTSYTFTPTAGPGICATTVNLPITVHPNTTPSFTQLGPYCQGSTPAALPLTSNNSISGTWSPSTISTTSVGNTTYTFTPTSTTVPTCATIATMVINISPMPTVSLSASTLLACPGDDIILTAVGSPLPSLGTYTWNNNPLITTNLQTVSLTNPGIYDFIVVYSLNGCTSLQDLVTITIQDAPSLTIQNNPNVTICEGGCVTLTALETSPIVPSGYIWSTGATTQSINVCPMDTMSYSVIGLSGSCESLPANTIVNVVPDPVIATQIVLDTNICVGGAYTFNISVSGGVGLPTYQWYQNSNPTNFGGTAIINATNAAYTTPVFNVQGTHFYYCVVSFPNSVECNTITTEVGSLYVLPDPTISITNGASQTLCIGEVADCFTTEVLGGVGTNTYLWIPTGAVTQTFCPPSDQVGTINYSVIVQQSGIACGSLPSNQASITVIPNPIINISGLTNVGCYGGNNGSISVIAQGGTPSYDYLWNNGQTTSTINGLSIGTYTVLVTDDLNCSSSMTFTISQPLGEMGITSTIVNTSCLNTSTGSIDLSILNGTPTYIYSWSNGATTEDISNLPSGDYTVIVTDALGCAINATITVEDPINPMNVTPTVSNLNCNGGSDAFISLAISGGVSPYDILWDNGETLPVIDSLSAGNYNVMVSDDQGCQTPLSFTIAQPAPIVASFNPSVTSGCSPLTVTFTNTSTGPFTNYLWNFGNGSTSSAANGSFTFSQPSCYNVSLIVSNAAGCADTLSADSLICVFAGPNASFVTSSGGIDFYSGQLALQNTSDGAISDYQWSFGDGSPNSSLENPIHYYPEEQVGTYLVILSVIDTNGCVDTTSYLFSLVENLSVYVPNTITINDDNINEVFLPVFSNVDILQSYQLEIFNRWGELIWETDIVSKGWNGRYKGNKDVQIGTYTWKIQYTDNASVSRIMLGHVNVIR